jgi:hypothetical protein
MKEHVSAQYIKDIKERMEAMSTFLLGLISLPLGVLWLGLGMIDLFYIGERQFPLSAGWLSGIVHIVLQLVQLSLFFPVVIAALLVGTLLYFFYRGRKIGTWLPHLGMPARNWILTIAIIIIFTVALILHYLFEPGFPWLGLVFGVLYSAGGMMGTPRRWYYPAVALIMMGISFLPLLLGGGGLWTRSVCFLTYGLPLVFTGWLDHCNLKRLLQPLPEASDGQTV